MTEEYKIKTFKDLEAWKEGHQLVLMIYIVTKMFPKEESFCLTSQLRRAIVSYTSNVAEGFSRRSSKDKAHFYTMALGSLTEVQSQLEIAKDVEYIDVMTFTKLNNQAIIIHKITNGLIKSVKMRRN
ncbi:MAG: Ribosomal protein S23 [Parcubacteria group bacterium GW2011_GWC2_39_14]|nr:MAG: Ribosomal protein S23 [Parcubacteria group bacterium GW2011_GWC2_39_14]KKR55522.1 MAG: Ribosomal protein S23 [Parcubacteria group bacterium GW2011_GWA2_40_23]